jgi:hypothetical protein
MGLGVGAEAPDYTLVIATVLDNEPFQGVMVELDTHVRNLCCVRGL